MKKQLVIIERGTDGLYSAYAPDMQNAPIGTGTDIAEARKDFLNTVSEMRDVYNKDGKHIPEELDAEFEFQIKSTAFPHIEGLLRHITKEYPEQEYYFYEMLLDWLTVAYFKPQQKLPIILLISRERSTGKTSFLHLLKMMFQSKAVIGDDELIEYKVNSLFTGKQVVGIDSHCIGEYKYSGENLKYYQTKTPLKFVLCADEIHARIFLPKDDVRYWVMKTKPLSESALFPNFEFTISEEIPAFLDFLKKRMDGGCMYVKRETRRYWFQQTQFYNDDLASMMAGTSSYYQGTKSGRDLLNEILSGKEALTYNDVKACLRHLVSQIPSSDDPCEEYTFNCAPRGGLCDIAMHVRVRDLTIHLDVMNFVSDKD